MGGGPLPWVPPTAGSQMSPGALPPSGPIQLADGSWVDPVTGQPVNPQSPQDPGSPYSGVAGALGNAAGWAYKQFQGAANTAPGGYPRGPSPMGNISSRVGGALHDAVGAMAEGGANDPPTSPDLTGVDLSGVLPAAPPSVPNEASTVQADPAHITKGRAVVDNDPAPVETSGVAGVSPPLDTLGHGTSPSLDDAGNAMVDNSGLGALPAPPAAAVAQGSTGGPLPRPGGAGRPAPASPAIFPQQVNVTDGPIGALPDVGPTMFSMHTKSGKIEGDDPAETPLIQGQGALSGIQQDAGRPDGFEGTGGGVLGSLGRAFSRNLGTGDQMVATDQPDDSFTGRMGRVNSDPTARMLMEAGLATMAAAGKPGSTFLGSLGEGGMQAANSAQSRDERKQEMQMRQQTLASEVYKNLTELGQGQQKINEDVRGHNLEQGRFEAQYPLESALKVSETNMNVARGKNFEADAAAAPQRLAIEQRNSDTGAYRASLEANANDIRERQLKLNESKVGKEGVDKQDEEFDREVGRQTEILKGDPRAIADSKFYNDQINMARANAAKSNPQARQSVTWASDTARNIQAGIQAESSKPGGGNRQVISGLRAQLQQLSPLLQAGADDKLKSR